MIDAEDSPDFHETLIGGAAGHLKPLFFQDFVHFASFHYGESAGVEQFEPQPVGEG